MKVALSLRERLFLQGTRALNAMGFEGEYYACPICGKLFGPNELQNAELTLEHVPPRSQNGKAIILTCKICNSRAGHLYEYSLSDRDEQKRRLNAFNSDNDVVGPVSIEIDGKKLTANLSKRDGQIDFELHTKFNNPNCLKDFISIFSVPKLSSQIVLNLARGYRKDNVRLADLKSAFLICAANFGYSFALSDNLRFVRRQLLNGKEDKYQLVYFYFKELPRSSIFVDLQCQLILVKFNGAAMLLPLSTMTEDDFLKTVQNRVDMNLVGGYQRFPQDFIAQIDNLGNGKVIASSQLD